MKFLIYIVWEVKMSDFHEKSCFKVFLMIYVVLDAQIAVYVLSEGVYHENIAKSECKVSA